ncbi:MAG: hypothetical protein GC183_03475 [Thiobacillus sp.]|nr:hypothetical protein [Thiobacillus sp.]
MSDLLEKLNTITRWKIGGDGPLFGSEKTAHKGNGSPFESGTAARTWLKSLPADSTYDTHHALVEGLERFNAERVDGDAERLKVLRAIEETGMRLQLPIVEQYMQSQVSLPLARQALWRESWAFWSLLAAAWFRMLKHAYKGPAVPDLQPWRAEIAARALHYIGLAMRWDYHNAQPPSAAAWQRVHNIYRMAERDGFADTAVALNGRQTTCAREYALTLVIALTNPLDQTARQIEEIAQLFEHFSDLPLPEASFDSVRHTHAVDLSLNEGPFSLEDNPSTGAMPRFFDLTPLVEHLESIQPHSAAAEDEGLYRRIANGILSDDVRRSSRRLHRFGPVWVASGMGNILASLAGFKDGRPRQAMESWMLRDESADGMGFSLDASAALPHGRLIAVSRNASENTWELLAIRWNQKTEGQLLVGAQRLSRHPRRVEISFAQVADGTARASTYGVLLPMSDTDEDLSNLLLSRSHYQPGAQVTFRDGDTHYSARLGQVFEDHERWLRVNIDVLSSEQLEAAA